LLAKKNEFTSVKEKLPLIKNVNLDWLKNQCQLLNEFASGEGWLYHEELFGLVTNLHWIEGGQKLFVQSLLLRREYGDKKYGDKKRFFERDISRIHRVQYQPSNCTKYCFYHKTCYHHKNILDFLNKKIQPIEVSERKYITINEARLTLSNKFYDFLTSDEELIHVIKAPTGIGKTELFTNIGKIIIATPSHKLKDEISTRIIYPEALYDIFPELPKFNIEDERKILSLYQAGLFQSAFKLIVRNAGKGNIGCRNYLAQIQEIGDGEKSILTTHHRLLLDSNLNLDGRTVIIDEDPISLLLKQGSVTYNDLLVVKRVLVHYQPLLESEIEIMFRVFDDIEQDKIISSHFESLLEFIEDEGDFLAWYYHWGGRSNILEFFHSDFFVKTEIEGKLYYKFIRKRNLPESKTLLFSATANQFIYEKLYGNKIVFHDIEDVAFKGTLLQDTSRSYSRYQLNHANGHLEGIVEIVGSNPVITFKDYKHLFINCILHFGATTGIDKYRGMDIDVVGTPHFPEDVIKFYASVLGVEFTEEDFNYKNREVEYNGFRFTFYTCSEKEELVRLQLSLIEAELVQAVGRARLLIENATVRVFSKLPLVGAKFVDLHK